jgi:hypothetical protein
MDESDSIPHRFTKAQRMELNAWSKRVFGSTSHWYNKIYKKGIVKSAIERELKPTEVSVRYYLDYASIKAFLVDLDKKQQDIMAEMKAKGQLPDTNSKLAASPS